MKGIWRYFFTNGETRDLNIDPADDKDIDVIGLDPEGRVVVRYMGGYSRAGGWLFGLTLCCNASDKGVEDGVVCRGCYDTIDVGAYDPPVVARAAHVMALEVTP